MTDKFDNGTNNKGIKSDRPGRRAGGWDDFLADFKNEDDIEVHSLEDLGIDDDFDLSELQSTSDVTSATIKVPPLPSRNGVADDPEQKNSRQRIGQHSPKTDITGTESTPSAEIDLSIFDELDD